MPRHEPSAITIETPPVTHTTTTTYTMGGRRYRNNNAANTNNHLAPTTSREDAGGLEPFPSAPSFMETPSNRGGDYFTPTPLQYQVRQRPIGIRRLTSSNDVQQPDLQRQRSNSALKRRRTNTGPRDHELDDATASLAGLPGHYEIGSPANAGAMGTIDEDYEAHHGETPRQGRGQTSRRQSAGSEGGVGRSGSKRLHRMSDAARSVLSKTSNDPDEDNLRRPRAHTAQGRDYESDVVDYLDVLGR